MHKKPNAARSVAEERVARKDLPRMTELLKQSLVGKASHSEQDAIAVLIFE